TSAMYPRTRATSRQDPVSLADPSAVRYRSCRVPPRDPLRSDVFNATLALASRSEEHTSELQSLTNIVCRLLLEKKTPTERPGAVAPERTGPENAGTADLRARTDRPSASSGAQPTSEAAPPYRACRSSRRRPTPD